MPQNIWVMLLIVILLITVAYSLYRSSLTKKYTNQLGELLVNKDFKTFDSMVNDPKVKKAVYPFNLDYMKLNSYMLRGDRRKIDAGFETFQKVNLNRKQKETIAVEGFTYYMGIRNKEKAKYFLDLMNQSSTNKAILDTSNEYYGIVYEGKTDKLEEMLLETEALPEEEKSFNEYLISVMYRTLGDKEKAEEYEKRYKSH